MGKKDQTGNQDVRIEDLERELGSGVKKFQDLERELGKASTRIEDLEKFIEDDAAAGPMGRPPSVDEVMDTLVSKAGTEPLQVLRYLTKVLKNRKAAPAREAETAQDRERTRLAKQKATKAKWEKERDARRRTKAAAR